MRILVVGGAGYIGSVVSGLLVSEGNEVIILDNLYKGHREALPCESACKFIQGDMGNKADLTRAFSYGIDAVMHFAALSLVGESVQQPAKYFENNVSKGLTLLDAMLEHKVTNFIFSSTAAVYGEPDRSPITEDFPLVPTSPYGDSKLAFEKILKWYAVAYGLKYVSLRYFNAAGASGCLGEDHSPETHLIPIIMQVALKVRPRLTIYGDDYPTPDGTCIRDYIHVEDLSSAHIMAARYLIEVGQNQIFNLGNGRGASVKEVITAAERVTGLTIPVEIGARRPGDPAVLVASNEKIQRELGWKPANSSMEKIIGDAWRWHKEHPQGYASGSAAPSRAATASSKANSL